MSLAAIRPGFDPAPMRLYTMDAWVHDPSALVDDEALRTLLHAAATVGGARVVGEAFHVFPNGAVTGALLLAQSHLTVHTWPEHHLLNVDLLSCGPVDGDAVLAHIREGLRAERARVSRVARGVG